MKKRVFVILALFWILISFLIIKSTYAKYLTVVDASTNVGIASWNIILNTQDVISNSNFSENLTLTFPETTYKIADCVVPGSIGYFDLNVDCSQLNVRFQYTVTCTFPSTNEIADMKVIGYSLDGSSNMATLRNYNDPITNNAASSANTTSIRVYIQWIDDAADTVTQSNNETLNNVQDTAIALAADSAVVTANVKFEQIQ